MRPLPCAAGRRAKRRQLTLRRFEIRLDPSNA
jgi:hypothetical protein